MKRLRAVFSACVAGFSLTGAGCATIDLQADAMTPLPRAVTQDVSAAETEILSKAHEYAQLAMRPYREGSTAWELVATSEDLMGRRRSGFDGALFRKEDSCTAVFYGYNAGNDLIDVVKAGFIGVPKQQLRDALAFTGKAAEFCALPVAELDLVGHSLGGYLAKAVAAHTDVAAVWAFNSPGFKRRDPSRFEKVFGEKEKEDPAGETPIYNFNASFDVVGKWGYQPGAVYEVETPKRHHAMAAMAEALRRAGPQAAAETSGDTAADGRAPEKRAGVITRSFNRIANSAFVQKRLNRKYRSPEPAPPPPSGF